MSEDKVVEISFESLGLSKPLEKMTAKELRQMIMEKIPQIQGASGMTKEDLVGTVKQTFGIKDEEGGVSPYKEQILGIKRNMKTLRAAKTQMGTRKEKEIARRKINKLKKRTRRLSKAV